MTGCHLIGVYSVFQVSDWPSNPLCCQLTALLASSLRGFVLPESKNRPARNDYDEETAYESYMNPEPDFQSSPGGSLDAD